MNVFENLRNGQHYNVVSDKDYVEQAHGEFARCAHICHLINSTDPNNKEELIKLEQKNFSTAILTRQVL